MWVSPVFLLQVTLTCASNTKFQFLPTVSSIILSTQSPSFSLHCTHTQTHTLYSDPVSHLAPLFYWNYLFAMREGNQNIFFRKARTVYILDLIPTPSKSLESN